jgi:hypothetical protein
MADSEVLTKPNEQTNGKSKCVTQLFQSIAFGEQLRLKLLKISLAASWDMHLSIGDGS